MTTVPIQIIANATGKPTDALLHTELAASTLVAVEKQWGPIRRNAARDMMKAGRQVPEHWHWDWEKKSAKLQLLAYRCLGIECDGKIQGLLMVKVAGNAARLSPDVGKPLVYVTYLESAPWNLPSLVARPAYGGIGMVLMYAAVQISREEGFHGRLALHALSQAESFYRDKCGMQSCGPDAANQNLNYYEMIRDAATKFQSNSSGGRK